MISSVADTAASVTEIRTKTSSCVSEIDFEHALMEAVSVGEDEGTDAGNEAISGKMTLSQIFEAASKKYNVPLELLKAVAKQESDFNTRCVSYAGAQGLMQLMPSTARSLGVTDSFDPWQNVMGGAKYLSQKLEMYNGNVRLALAAYNAGSGNVSKYGGVPPFKETQDYIKKVLAYMNQDISIPDVTVSVSDSPSSSVSAKRQAQANKLEIKASDGDGGKFSVSPSREIVVSATTNLSEIISEKLQLYLQEQKKTSVSSIMGKLLLNSSENMDDEQD